MSEPDIHRNDWPDLEGITDLLSLEEVLSRPTRAVVEAAARMEGDLVVLGAAGKMGPTLARMAKRAAEAAGVKRRVIGVARFSDPAVKERLESWGVETIAGDLLDESFVRQLPDAGNVVYMAGMKFGATGNEALTWAMNTLLPVEVCRRYADSRIAAFSTGNVYGMTPVTGGGSVETDVCNPQGEYAMSCLGRERTFEYYSRAKKTAVCLLRLNYACELRYGVIVDLAQRVWNERPIDLATGMVNVIWQGDANAMALLSLEKAASPAEILNIAGPEQLSVERIGRRLGELLGREPRFVGQPQAEALLSNGGKGHRWFGYPRVSVDAMMEAIAGWIQRGGPVLAKPTKFEVRDGRF